MLIFTIILLTVSITINEYITTLASFFLNPRTDQESRDVFAHLLGYTPHFPAEN